MSVCKKDLTAVMYVLCCLYIELYAERGGGGDKIQ